MGAEMEQARRRERAQDGRAAGWQDGRAAGRQGVVPRPHSKPYGASTTEMHVNACTGKRGRMVRRTQCKQTVTMCTCGNPYVLWRVSSAPSLSSAC